MAYTFNVPQANQQIAATQAPILANFTYIPQAIGTEHQWDAITPGNVIHLKCSMPNIGVEPAGLTSNANGIYYVFGGEPKYFTTTGTVNAIGKTFLTRSTIPSYTYGTTASATFTTTYQNLITVENNSCGTYFVYSTTDSTAYSIGSYIAVGSVATVSKNIEAKIFIKTVGLTFQGRANSGSVSDVKWTFNVSVNG